MNSPAPLVGKKLALPGGASARCLFCDPGGPIPAGAVEFQPCELCAVHMVDGVIVIGVADDGGHRTPYRTMVSDAWVRVNIQPAAVRDNVLLTRALFLPDALWAPLNLRKSQKRLYAVIFEYLKFAKDSAGRKCDPSVVGTEVRYSHADDSAEAIRGTAPGRRGEYRVVGAAPVVGFFVLDSHGDRLLA